MIILEHRFNKSCSHYCRVWHDYTYMDKQNKNIVVEIKEEWVGGKTPGIWSVADCFAGKSAKY